MSMVPVKVSVSRSLPPPHLAVCRGQAPPSSRFLTEGPVRLLPSPHLLPEIRLRVSPLPTSSQTLGSRPVSTPICRSASRSPLRADRPLLVTLRSRPTVCAACPQGSIFLSWDFKVRPSIDTPTVRPLLLPCTTSRTPPLRLVLAWSPACSVLAVSHDFDGFLRPVSRGSVAPRSRSWGSLGFVRHLASVAGRIAEGAPPMLPPARPTSPHRSAVSSVLLACRSPPSGCRR